MMVPKTNERLPEPGLAPTNSTVCVVTSCDVNYLPHVAVLASSMATSRHPSTDLELNIMQSGIPQNARTDVEVCAPGITINWIDVSEATFGAACGTPVDPLVNRPHYFRCLIEWVLPHNLKRCIYLDADTLIRSDLAELWKIDLQGATVGAALDYFLPRSGDAIGPWRELLIDPEAPYFNSGVLVIDLDRWRADKIGARAIRTCITHRDELWAQGKWPQHDQFGLNVVLHRHWRLIPQKWNYLSEMAPSDPSVVHYCGGGKPGSPTCQAEFSSWYWEVLNRTAWGVKAAPTVPAGAQATSPDQYLKMT